jgi:uncharacterized protein with PIN domain
MSFTGVTRTRFVADAMLGSLARKLRALGFDTIYYKAGEDAGIIRVAAKEGRIILTSDHSLAAMAAARKIDAILVHGNDDGSRISFLSSAAKRAGIQLVRGEPLCSLCGGELETMKRTDVRGLVPTSVEGSHRLFFRCKNCAQLYWRGSHWKKLRLLARRLEKK